MSISQKTPRVYRLEAVVLRGYNYGEADRILTLYSSQSGKVRALAKGVRRTKSKMSGHLDLFMRSSLLLARGRQLDIVTQADAIESFPSIRTSLERASYCGYVAELVDSFSGEEMASYPLYALLVNTFRLLGESDNLPLVTRSFEVQLLGMIGYRPQLQQCTRCNTPIEPVVNVFSSRLGGVLCPDCAGFDPSAPRVSASAMKILRNLQRNHNAVLGLKHIDPRVMDEVDQRLREYVTFRMEERPKSLQFIDQLERQ